MELRDKKVAILAEDQYEDLELWYPRLRLQEAGATVTIVGAEAGARYTSKHGYPVTADAAATDLDGGSFDAVVVPGGYAPDHMRQHEGMVALVRDANDAGRVVAAICHGGWVLASAEVLEGRRVTGYASIKDDLRHAGAEFVDDEVVRDGNLITSRQPADLPAFCRELIQAIREHAWAGV